jgi:uncharacterized protein YkwD
MSSSALRAPRRALLRMLLPFVTALAAMAVPSAARGESPRVDAREAAIIERVNAVRAQHGLSPLAVGRRLSRAADRHSRRMARARVLTHRLWGEGTLAGRLRWAVGDARVGEVIFWGHGAVRSAEVVRAWMDSPGHRDLLLSPQFSIAGIGIRAGGGGSYATVDLASQ